jgi:endonuclease/exonuclease/phosphatase (EEP) superfamily protein YafD
MIAIQTLTLILASVSLVAFIASLSKRDEWWIRMFDFPRLQITFITLGAIVLLLVQWSVWSTWMWSLLALLLISLIYQLVKIYPYTFFSKKEVMAYKGEDDERCVSILISNVLMPNKKYGELIGLVQQYQPDILLTLETDLIWEKELKVLERDYPHAVKVPLDNFYGMHLYSRLELHEMEVMYLIDPEIPSIHGDVILDSGEKVKIHCLHPMPPSPTESDTSTDRDAELLLVGKSIDTNTGPELVFGDLNDVAWSRTTRLFQEMSGLLDPRVGRGFFNTFHADHFLFRWPLDHVFHSNDFKVKEVKRLGHIGSDHFPMFIRLHLEPRAKQQQEEPEADQEEKEWAEEKIERAGPRRSLD